MLLKEDFDMLKGEILDGHSENLLSLDASNEPALNSQPGVRHFLATVVVNFAVPVSILPLQLETPEFVLASLFGIGREHRFGRDLRRTCFGGSGGLFRGMLLGGLVDAGDDRTLRLVLDAEAVVGLLAGALRIRKHTLLLHILRGTLKYILFHPVVEAPRSLIFVLLDFRPEAVVLLVDVPHPARVVHLEKFGLLLLFLKEACLLDPLISDLDVSALVVGYRHLEPVHLRPNQLRNFRHIVRKQSFVHLNP